MQRANGTRIGPDRGRRPALPGARVEGLRIVDISIIPEVIRRGPAATAVMLGERGAHFFEEDTAGRPSQAAVAS